MGLIGGSLGMALRRARRGGTRRFFVEGLGRSKAKLLKAKRLGALDAIAGNPKKSLAAADIVVFCVPVHRIVPLVQKNLRNFKKGAIITDVGSVKQAIVTGMKSALARRRDLRFVGAHPIAGSERTGVESARPDLFKNAVCVLTKDHAAFRALDDVHAMWSAAGARCTLMSAMEHDRWLAMTSHLPHLLAFALFSDIHRASAMAPLKSLVGGSFRDMTRIAGSDPELWTGVITRNRAEIRRAVDSFLKQLRFFSSAPAGRLQPALARLARAKRNWN